MIEPGWITSGIILIVNAGAIFYGAGKLTQKLNGVDHTARKAHSRVDVVEEKQNEMSDILIEVKTNVQWLVNERKNGTK